MIKEEKLPLLEFDENPFAFINPEHDVNGNVLREYTAKKAVICFFREAIEAYVKENHCEVVMTIKSETVDLPIYYDEKKQVLLVLGYLGGPGAGSEIEILNELGMKQIFTCGGAGVLQDIAVGHLMIPTSAVRDEGTSYHYVPAGYEVTPSIDLVQQVCDALDQRKLPYVKGKTWTTDGVFRETKAKTELRRQQGCICVEMECAAFYAVGQFRHCQVASILYGGDSLTADQWDDRQWHGRTEVRKNLLETAMEIMSEIQD